MGRTIPSYRIASQREIDRWRSFRKLLGEEERKKFDQMFSYSRLYYSAASNACRPELIHPILMSIIFEHYKQLTKLAEKKGIDIQRVNSPKGQVDEDD